MPFAAAVSEHPLATHAVGEVVGQVLESLGDRPDAALVFVTGPFAGAIEDIAHAVRTLLRPGALVGAAGSSVLAGGQEVEERAAVALFALSLGRRRDLAAPRAVRLTADRTPDGWHLESADHLAVPGATLVVLADPFSFPADAFVDQLVRSTPSLTVVGGLASAARAAGGNRLVADGSVVDRGAVGLLLPPGLETQAIVSQGCRPVGEPLVVTKANGNMVEEIAGQPALDRLLAQAEAANPVDRRLMARGLQVGLVIDERQATFHRGDFLIRDVLGGDHRRRTIAVSADVEVGTTIQFQVRDAESADEDLRQLLADAGGDAALVFTDAGRGTNLFPAAHHDAEILHQHVDRGAVAGLFCAGEIGPVGANAFVHALSATALLLTDP